MRKRLALIFSLISTAAFGLSAKTPDASALSAAGSFVCSILTNAPAFDDAAHFSAAFRAALTHEQLVQILGGVVHEFGSCKRAEVDASEARFTTDSGFVLQGTLVVDATGLITGLSFMSAEDAQHPVHSWADLKSAFAQLSGRSAAALVTFGEPGKVQTFGAAEPMAIGSTFKLYVLGALNEAVRSGKLHWGTSLPLRDEWKSLPGGMMQDLPTTYAPSVFEYAQKMISISDNTATDHLIHYVGRDAVASMVHRMGTAAHRGNDPFLTTLEMFKLKWGVSPATTQAYIDGTPAERNRILDSLANVPRTDVCRDATACEVPTHIDTIEWFATPAESCAAMQWLYGNGEPNIREILAANTPFIKISADSHWSYAGFKGGSEPGVIATTYVLHARSGRTGCLSLAWNDPAHKVSQMRFLGLVKQALTLAEQKIN